MTASVRTAALTGVEAVPVEVECDMNNGLPGVVVVGLATKAVEEARERIKSALSNSGLKLPPRRITLNLAPASLPKQGSAFDLPMALAILAASDQLPVGALEGYLVAGELSLDGSLKPVRGIVAYAELAARLKLTLLLPHTNRTQASLVENATLLPCQTLREAYRYLAGLTEVKRVSKQRFVVNNSSVDTLDLADIHGQESAKRAVEIAAAGNHNLLLDGPPGAGKTMLAQALVGILPPLTRAEMIEVTKLHSLSGEQRVVTTRPFRAPHHTASPIALVGGGRQAGPGEITLAHRGVLFLDELPEYPRPALESLRQPLESQTITVSRADGTTRYPADFMLVATSNPCPCGYFGDETRPCACPPARIDQYRRKLSGPLLDRVDLVVRVARIETSRLLSDPKGEESAYVAQRVLAARSRQSRRQAMANARLSNRQLKAQLQLEPDAKALLDEAATRLALTARGYVRVCKVARTIADLARSDPVRSEHVAEALHYRLAG